MTKPPSLRIRAAITSHRLSRRIIRGAEALHGGIWLGLLDDSALAAATGAVYGDDGLYADVEHNASGLSDWERDVVERHFPPAARVLVPAAGGGRELFGLEDLGHSVVGFDPSEHLVAVGRSLIEQRASGVRLVLSDPDEVPQVPGGPFDAALFGWAGYVHIRRRGRRVRFLRELRGRVIDGAPLVVSFFLRSEGGRQFAIVRDVAVVIRRVRRSGDAVELGDTVAGTFEHYFTWSEIGGELADGGFEVIDSSNAVFPYVVARAV